MRIRYPRGFKEKLCKDCIPSKEGIILWHRLLYIHKKWKNITQQV